MTVDIKTRLTLDDRASRELKKIKSGFKATAKESKNAAAGAAGFAKQVAAVALGTHLPAILRGVKEIATGWLDAATAAYDQEQALAAINATMRGMPWEEARGEAEKTHRELLDMAIDIGQNADDVARGFGTLLTYIGDATDESFERAKVTMRELTTIANTSGKAAAETLATEYGAMVDGMVRTKGPLFQLIKGTGIFGKDLTKASATWAKMNKEARELLLSDAIEKTSVAMGEATPTFNDLIESLEGLKRRFVEDIGAPVVRALIPVLKGLKETIKDFRPQLEGFAQIIGRDIAQGAKDAADWVRQGFEWAMEHQNEIRDGLKDAANWIKEAFITAKETVQWIISNKEILAGILGGAKVGGVGGAAAGLGLGVAGSQAGELGAGSQALGTLGAAGGVAAGAALLGASAAVTLALGGLAAAAYQGVQLYEEAFGDLSEEALDAYAKMELAQKAYNKGNFQAAEKWANDAKQVGDKGREISAKMLAAIAERKKQEDDLRNQLNQALKETNLAKAIEVYNKAVSDGNEEMRKMAAETIMSSDKLKSALDEGKVKIVGGMDALTKAANDSFAEFEKSMATIAAEAKALATTDLTLGMKTKGGRVQFQTGPTKADKTRAARRKARRAALAGTTINVNKMEIKQEFRDQDPDRVAIIFRRDIVNAAIKRVQSRRATIFGI